MILRISYMKFEAHLKLNCNKKKILPRTREDFNENQLVN